ncbi:toll/interleukin-1 receptor domain-containing protein, partial [bacterium]|nr:toll/interleukin-1 receptor domain-containing protein [bacterium]
MKHFYISYHDSDLDWAEWIAKQLEEVGYSILLRSWDTLKPGNYLKELEYNASFANGIIIILSTDYFDMIRSLDEWISLLLELSEEKHSNLMAIKVGECSLYALLPQSIFFLDLVNLDKPKAKKALLKAANLTSLMVPDLTNEIFGKTQRFIRGLPRIWNIPYTKNPNFTGRESILAKMWKLHGSDELKKRSVVLYGLSGMGKSRVAVEYAYQYSEHYDVIWWLRAERSTTIASGLLDLAKKLKLVQDKDEEQSSIIDAVLRWLENQPYWLLIFDNVDDFNLVKKYLPKNDKGNIIFTSRNPTYEENATQIPVKALNRSDSIELLSKYTGQSDKENSDKLAKELGDLPLVLEQVSTYIKENEFTISSYIDLLKKPELDFSSKLAASADYPETITTVFELTFQKAEEQYKGAIEFLTFCSFLAPDDIPIKELKQETAGLTPNLNLVFKDNEAIDKMLHLLESYSLITVADSMITIHRLVQKIVRDKLDDQSRRDWIDKLYSLFNDVFTFDRKDLGTWKTSSCLFPHILAFLDNVEDSDQKNEGAGILLNKVGDYLIHIDEFTEAEKILNHALSINESIYGTDHPEYAKVISNLGGIKYLFSEYEKALEHTKRAYEIYKATYGLNNSIVSEELKNIGYILIILDKFENALEHYELAMDINKSVKGADHPDIGHCLINIGYIKVKLGKREDGLKDVEKGLEIIEKGYGLKHPRVSIAYVNLGYVFKEIGNYQKAFECFERSYLISKEIYGSGNSKIGRALIRLGQIKLELG